MAVAVGDVFAFALNQRLFGQQVINTGALRVSAIPGATSELAFITSVFGTDGQGLLAAGGWAASLADLQTTEVTYLNWFVSRVTPNPTNIFTVLATGILGGVSVGTCETPNIAMSVTRLGLDVGKRNKGRVAVAGIPTDAISAGVFSPDRLALGAGFAQWLWRPGTGGAGVSYTMGFYVPAHQGIAHGQVVNYPAKYTDCVDARAQRTVRVQRSRTVGVGR